MSQTAKASGHLPAAGIRFANSIGDYDEPRPAPPPFTDETAAQKVRLAEDAWNSRDPARVALAYTPDSQWRNRSDFIAGREEIVAFLTRKWERELDYRLIKQVWARTGNRIAVRFAYKWHDASGQWFRSYALGNDFGYCNTGFLIAAVIAETTMGKSYEYLMRREVFDPSGCLAQALVQHQRANQQDTTMASQSDQAIQPCSHLQEISICPSETGRAFTRTNWRTTRAMGSCSPPPPII